MVFLLLFVFHFLLLMSFIKGILKLSEVMFILDEKNTYIASSCVIV